MFAITFINKIEEIREISDLNFFLIAYFPYLLNEVEKFLVKVIEKHKAICKQVDCRRR